MYDYLYLYEDARAYYYKGVELEDKDMQREGFFLTCDTFIYWTPLTKDCVYVGNLLDMSAQETLVPTLTDPS